jgi:hypothetical protein|uniref:Uncharacterized protein n=1 Tax=viral metagenome TaxID=1070528 RepID=A0A6C0KWT5_9ZZZZ
MSLTYSFIDYKSPVPCPERKVNGGLYTGEKAYGPWGNYPVVPETHILAQNLLSADPPPLAIKQPASFERPGNNHVILPYHIQPDKNLNIRCIGK